MNNFPNNFGALYYNLTAMYLNEIIFIK